MTPVARVPCSSATQSRFALQATQQDPTQALGLVPLLCCPPAALQHLSWPPWSHPLPLPCPLAFSGCGCSSRERSPLRITHNLSFLRRVGEAPVTPQWVLLAVTQGSVTLALQAWLALSGSGALNLTGLLLLHRPLLGPPGFSQSQACSRCSINIDLNPWNPHLWLSDHDLRAHN